MLCVQIIYVQYECTGDTPFVRQTAPGKHWIAALPLEQPSDREHAAALDVAMREAIASGAEAAARSGASDLCCTSCQFQGSVDNFQYTKHGGLFCRALEYRTEAAQRCNASSEQQVSEAMQHIQQGSLCPELPAVADACADTAPDALFSAPGVSPSGSSGDAAFWGASAGLALAVFMAEMVSQVRSCFFMARGAQAAHVLSSNATSRWSEQTLYSMPSLYSTGGRSLCGARLGTGATVERAHCHHLGDRRYGSVND